MNDLGLLEHPVVTRVRELEREAARAGQAPSPVAAAEVERHRDELLALLHGISDAAEELRAAAVQVPVVLDAEHVGRVREGVARFMTMNVVLWQALPLASREHGVTRVVRDALVAVMSQVADVIEICLFKLDTPLATSLQQRLAAIPDEVAPTDNWREILADL